MSFNTPLQMSAVGIQTTSGTTTPVAIPVKDDGNTARYVLITVDGATGNVYFRPGNSSVTAVVGTACPLSEHAPLVLNVAGHTHIAILGVGGTPLVTITPLENA